MSHYNPEIYNYEALKPEHKRMIDVYDVAKEDALNRDFIIGDVMGLHGVGGDDAGSVLDRIKREVAEEVFDAIEEYMEGRRLEYIVSIMDGDKDYYEPDKGEAKE